MIDYGYKAFLDTLDEENIHLIRLWRNNYEIWKWCRQNDLITEQSHEKWLDGLTGDNTRKMYMIKDHENDIPVGVCGLTDINHLNQRAEFSCYVAPSYQCQGYAHAALMTLFTHGFDNLNLNVIWGETFAGNKALDLFLKLGMKEEGIRRQFYYKDGKFLDCHLISLLKSEWARFIEYKMGAF